MWITGWNDQYGCDIYEGDVIRDLDGYIGAVVWWREEGCFAVMYERSDPDRILALAECKPSTDLMIVGNIYEHYKNVDW
jgi:hypothetical protein